MKHGFRPRRGNGLVLQQMLAHRELMKVRKLGGPWTCCIAGNCFTARDRHGQIVQQNQLRVWDNGEPIDLRPGQIIHSEPGERLVMHSAKIGGAK